MRAVASGLAVGIVYCRTKQYNFIVRFHGCCGRLPSDERRSEWAKNATTMQFDIAVAADGRGSPHRAHATVAMAATERAGHEKRERPGLASLGGGRWRGGGGD